MSGELISTQLHFLPGDSIIIFHNRPCGFNLQLIFIKEWHFDELLRNKGLSHHLTVSLTYSLQIIFNITSNIQILSYPNALVESNKSITFIICSQSVSVNVLIQIKKCFASRVLEQACLVEIEGAKVCNLSLSYK